MIHFEHINLLWLLLSVPLFTVLFVLARRRARRQLLAYADNSNLLRLRPQQSHRRPAVKFILLMTALACFIVALANPQVGTKMVKGQRLGADIAICMDVSQQHDGRKHTAKPAGAQPNAPSELRNQLGADRISLVVFAGSAYTDAAHQRLLAPPRCSSTR